LKESPVIEIEDLHYIYPSGVHALRGVSLMIYENEIHAIIGQNGSGKTTLAKHLNGLLKPTRGRVLVLSKDTKKLSVPELSKYVGYVFQNPNHQLFNTTVEKELAFGPQNLSLSPGEVKERVMDAAKFFDLIELLRENPLNMSYPMKKIIAIASIYAMKPPIFVLDEPTTGLDSYWKLKVLEMVKKMNHEGYTVIIISHDMWLVTECAERITVLWNGEILKTDEPTEIFREREILEKTKLRPPQIALLARRFGRDDILTVKEMEDYILSRVSYNLLQP